MILKDKLKNQEYEYILTAHSTPSGLSWIMTILINLGILVNVKEKNRDNFVWDFLDNNTATFSDYFKKSIGPIMFPTFMNKKIEFTENMLVNTTHLPIFEGSENKKIILSTRDIRDSLYSYYRRLFPEEKTSFYKILYPEEKISFENYLLKNYHLNEKEFISDSVNFWCMYDKNNKVIPILDDPNRWAFWTGLWLMNIKKENLLILNFENWKKNPIKEVNNLLEFLQIKKSKEEILTAIENSDFKKSKEMEMNSDSPLWLHHRKGEIGEWKEVYNDKMLALFKGLPYAIMNYLGYETEFTLKDFESILLTINNIRGFDIEVIKNIYHKLNKVISYLEIGKDFNSMLQELFPKKKFLSYQIRRVLLVTSLAICYTKFFTSKEANFNFIDLSFNEYETKIFKSLVILIFNSDDKVLINLNKKMRFEL